MLIFHKLLTDLDNLGKGEGRYINVNMESHTFVDLESGGNIPHSLKNNGHVLESVATGERWRYEFELVAIWLSGAADNGGIGHYFPIAGSPSSFSIVFNDIHSDPSIFQLQLFRNIIRVEMIGRSEFELNSKFCVIRKSVHLEVFGESGFPKDGRRLRVSIALAVAMEGNVMDRLTAGSPGSANFNVCLEASEYLLAGRETPHFHLDTMGRDCLLDRCGTGELLGFE